MAQIGVQQPTNLMEMYSSGSPMMWDIANQQVNQQAQSNYLNQQQAAQDMNFQAQEQPFNLQKMYLGNQTTAAQLPGVQAQSNLLSNQADVSNSTLDMQKKAKLSDLAKNMSDADLTEAENAVKIALTHPSAAVRQQAQAMWGDLSSVKELKLKNELEGNRALAVTQEQGNQARLTDAQAASEGKYIRRYNISVDQQIQNENDPIKKDAAIRGALARAKFVDDKEGISKYMGDLIANKPAYDAKQAQLTAANSSKVNAPVMTGLPGIQSPTAEIPGNDQSTPATPATPTAPAAPKAKPTKMNPDSYAKWFNAAKAQNPGMSDAQIEQEAIKRGYK